MPSCFETLVGGRLAVPIGCAAHKSEVSFDLRRERDRRPRRACHRRSADNLGKDRVGGTQGRVAPHDPIETVAILLDDSHPGPQCVSALIGERVLTTFATGNLLARHFDQTVGLELAERAIHIGAIDRAETQAACALHQAVPVIGFLRQQQEECGEQEVAGRPQVEAREKIRVTQRMRVVVNHGHPLSAKMMCPACTS